MTNKKHSGIFYPMSRSFIPGAPTRSDPPKVYDNVILSVCIFILFMELVERMCFYGLTGSLKTFLFLHLDYSNFQANALASTMPALVYMTPLLGGFIADTMWGRYKTIFLFGMVYLAGAVLMTYSSNPNNINKPLFMFSLYGLISIGAGGIRPNVVSLGADQFLEGNENHENQKMSYFDYFYWAINIGALIAFGYLAQMATNGSGSISADYGFFYSFLICSAALALGLLAFLAMSGRYVLFPPKGNSMSGFFAVFKSYLCQHWKGIFVLIGITSTMCGFLLIVVAAFLENPEANKVMAIIGCISAAFGLFLVGSMNVNVDWIGDAAPVDTTGTKVERTKIEEAAKMDRGNATSEDTMPTNKAAVVVRAENSVEKNFSQRADDANTDAVNTDAVNTDAVNTDAVNTDAVNTDAVNTDAVNTDAVNTDAVNTDAVNTDAVNTDAVNTDAVNTDAVKDLNKEIEVTHGEDITKEDVAIEVVKEDETAVAKGKTQISDVHLKTKETVRGNEGCPVADAREMWRIMPAVLCATSWAIAYSQMGSTFISEACQMDLRVGGSSQLNGTVLNLADCLAIIICIPLFDRYLYPFIERVKGSPFTVLQKMACGFIVTCLAMISAAVIEIQRRQAPILEGQGDSNCSGYQMSDVSVFWMIIPFFLVGVGEVLIVVQLYHLCYIEVPAGMKSTAQALQLLTLGLGNAIAAGLSVAFQSFVTDDLNDGHLEYLYFTIAGIELITYFLFVYAVKDFRYKAESAGNAPSIDVSPASPPFEETKEHGHSSLERKHHDLPQQEQFDECKCTEPCDKKCKCQDDGCPVIGLRIEEA